MENNKTVFITGGSGYIGRRLIPELIKNNFEVIALARKGSESKIPRGCKVVVGNALDAKTFSNEIPDGCRFIHMIGVAHPSPAKKQQFIDIDLASIKSSVEATREKNISQFIYISVAQPNNVMKDYANVRVQGEELVKANFPNATFLRPFYVLGPGHYWPIALLPLYKILELIPSTSAQAKSLGLITLKQMIHALAFSVNNPVNGIRILDVPMIKQISHSSLEKKS
jgi:uncharacterized protein YbjT (DUF2867 family)